MAAAAAPAPLVVFIKRTAPAAFPAYEGEAFAKLVLPTGADVSDLVARACAQFFWGPPTRAQLLLVPHEGLRKPSADAEAAAVLLDEPALPLADVGVCSGSWLLARVSPPAAAPVDPRAVAVAATGASVAELEVAFRALLSPTAAAENFFGDEHAALTAEPVSFLAPPAVVAAWGEQRRRVREGSGEFSRGLMRESSWYGAGAELRPPFAEPVGSQEGDMEASALLTEAALLTRGWRFAAASRPELHVRAITSKAAPFRPAFNGELKTAGDG